MAQTTRALKRGPQSRIVLPNNWEPRDYQLPLWTALEQGCKRAVAIWHRRAGKDDVCLHFTATQMVQRPANYWHMLPVKEQARKAIWTAVNPHTGVLRIDEAFPKELRKNTLENEMRITFLNDASWQVVGSDNFDTSVGAAPAGLVFSEWALAKPTAWPILQPILEENGGYALFITTPRGRNHAMRTLETARKHPNTWFHQVLPASETGVFAAGQLEAIRLELMDQYGPELGEALFRQEYMCSFEGAVLGAFYAAELNKLDNKNRITSCPYESAYPVYTAWDIGIDDATSIWFIQIIGREICVIDYYETMNKGAAEVANVVKGKGYNYAEHILPHDNKQRDKGSGKSYDQQLKDAGLRNTRTVLRPRDGAAVIAGINQGRALFSRCTFDAAACERGLDCLRNYKSEWDENAKVLSTRPKHDWSSHGADAWRTLAVGLRGSDASRDEWGNTAESLGDLSPNFGTMS